MRVTVLMLIVNLFIYFLFTGLATRLGDPRERGTSEGSCVETGASSAGKTRAASLQIRAEECS